MNGILPDPTSVRIQDALVTINRCMVIDKKDMKIHWFMERYTKEQRKRQSTKDIFKGMSGHRLRIQKIIKKGFR